MDLTNPGFLKLELMAKGISVDERYQQEVYLMCSPRASLGVPDGIDLILPEDTYVYAPACDRLARSSPYLLTKEKGRFVIACGDLLADVEVVPQPSLMSRSTSTGIPFSQFCRVYGGYIAINPIASCEFFTDGLECRFCGVDGRVKEQRTVEEVLEAVHQALSEGAADYVHLNTGFFTGEDGGVALLAPYIEAIKKRFDTLVCIQVQPPKSNSWIDQTYALGVDSVAYNLEVFDPETFERVCPGKAQLIGRDRFFKALEYAARVFPEGAVVSNLIVGLETPESTMAGIDALTRIGVVPTLSLFHPVEGTDLAATPPPDTEKIVPIFAHLFQSVKRHKLKTGWIRHYSVVVNAMEGHFFTGDKEEGILSSVLRLKKGGRIARNISKLRRKLRVRNVSDSLESSGL